MCSNFEPITRKHEKWVWDKFQCELPFGDWNDQIYPNMTSPIVLLKDGKASCVLANFGLILFWAANKPRFGTHTYNARSDDGIASKPSFRNAWKKCQFSLALMQSFYEPYYEEGNKKSMRWRIMRRDKAPIAIASIWESYIDKDSGEIIFSQSLLTINANGHPVMQQFHKPGDEKRTIVALEDSQYLPWLHATLGNVSDFLRLTDDDFLVSEPSPLKKAISASR